MNVATAIEMGAGGHSDSSQGLIATKTAGNAANSTRSGVVAANPAQSAAPGAESFRANWQSVLASLGQPIDGLSEDESETGVADGIRESAGTEAGGTSSRKGSINMGAGTQARGTASASFEKRDNPRSTSGSVIDPKLSDSPAARLTGKTTQQLVRRGSVNPVDRNAEDASSGKSSANLHSFEARSSPKIQRASAESSGAAPVALPEMVSMAVKLSELVRTPENNAEISKQASSSVVPSGLREGAGTEPFSRSRSGSDNAGSVAGGTTSRVTGPVSNHGAAVDHASHENSADGDLLPTSVDSGPSAGKGTASDRDTLPESNAKEARAADSLGVGAEQQRRFSAPLLGQETDAAGVVAPSLGAGTSSTNADSAARQAFADPAITALGDRPGGAGAARTPGQIGTRAGHVATGKADLTLRGTPVAGEQLSSSQLDAIPLAREAVGMVRADNGAAAPQIGVAGTAAEVGGRETFAALDKDAGAGTPTWIHAGAQRAEAGFQDPVLGWVGVRADGSGGGLHASLVPGSTDAAQALGGHLAGLNTYLAEQHVPVQPVTLAWPESRSGGFGMTENSNQTLDQGGGQGMGQDSGQGAQRGQELSAHSATPADGMVANREVVQPVDRLDAGAYSGRDGGTHISVVA